MNLKEYTIKVRQIVQRLLKEGRADELRQELRRLSDEIGVNYSDLLKAARAEIYSMRDIFVGDHIFTDLLAKNYTGIKKAFDEKVFETVRRGVIRNDSFNKIESRLRDIGDTAKQHIYTVQNTIKLGLNRAGSLEAAIERGIKKFRYAGPTFRSRPFCIQHVGKIYTLAEITSMDNGQGLPVLYYCGGYNCRHHWEDVI